MTAVDFCPGQIDLATPKSREKVRAGFQPPYKTVFVYECPLCKEEIRIAASAFIGLRKTPSGQLVPIRAVPMVGATRCGRPR